MSRKTRYTNEQLKLAVETSLSFRETLIKLGLCGDGGGNTYHLKEKVKILGIDTSHFLGQGFLKGRKHNWNKKFPLEDKLKENTFIPGMSSFKKRLINENVLEEKCYKCNIDEWQGEPLSLQLDHKNGDRNDNRKENLRLLCPNCHSQTTTFAGKNKNKRPSSPTAGGN